MERIMVLELRIDTLELKTSNTSARIEQSEARITINEQEIRGLRNDLDSTNTTNAVLTEDVKRLITEIEGLKKSSIVPKAVEVKRPVTNGPNRDPEDGMKVGFSKDYLDLNGNSLAQGNYVIVGVFANELNASNFKTIAHGSIVILNKMTTLHYVYTFFSVENDPVYSKLKNARRDITEEAWILRLK
jgi:uncharacterized coiled-coil protein SlyX